MSVDLIKAIVLHLLELLPPRFRVFHRDRDDPKYMVFLQDSSGYVYMLQFNETTLILDGAGATCYFEYGNPAFFDDIVKDLMRMHQYLSSTIHV